MKRLFFRLNPIIAAIVICATVISAATPTAKPQWETVDTVVVELSVDRFDVTVRDNYVYVYAPQATNIKMFTILGQLVSQASISEGTSRLKVNTRGIYILKAGPITRRITI